MKKPPNQSSNPPEKPHHPDKDPASPKEARITKEMTIGEVVMKHPQAAPVMLKHGLHCIGCHVAHWESLEEGAKGHGLSDAQVEALVSEMNDVVHGAPQKSRKKPEEERH